MRILPLTQEEWDAFIVHKQFRDECCMKIGVLEYESQELRARYVQQIQQSLREEERVAREIASRNNIPESAHWTIADGSIKVSD